MPYVPFTDDPVADFHRYDMDQEKRVKQLPQCLECEQPITDENAYKMDDGWICESCMNEHWKAVEPNGS